MIIYKATNIINGKVYIGQTIRTLHERVLDHGYKPRGVFGRATKKYGMSNFKFEVIDDSARTIEELNELEIGYIKSLNTMIPNGYNIKEGGENKNTHPDTIRRLKLTKQYPIDCKCIKTGVTYSFRNSTEVVSIGCKSANVIAALNRNRISNGFYWKRRDEEFPMDVQAFAEANRTRGTGGNKGKKLTKDHKNKVIKSLNRFRDCDERKRKAKEACIKSRGRAVVDSNGVFYRTVSEATKKTGANNIDKVLRGERNHSKGLTFRYATEFEVAKYDVKVGKL